MVKKCERIIPEKIIPEKIIPEEKIEYWKTSDDKEFDFYAQACAHEKHLNSLKSFANVRRDSKGYWPQNTTNRGMGYEHVFASTETVRNWLVENENLVMNFYKKIGEFNNETN